MAHDYMAVPGSTCLTECSFSMSAHTDDVQRWQMDAEKFRELQQLRSAYHDGHLEGVKEAWMEVEPDFDWTADDENGTWMGSKFGTIEG